MFAAVAGSAVSVRPFALVCSALGAAAWGAAVLYLQPDWAATLLLLAPLSLVPLAFALLLADQRLSELPLVGQAALALQGPAAVCLACAFVPAPGSWAGLLTVPWLVVTGLVAAFGLLRLRQRGWASLEEVCPSVGLVFLAVGGGWVFLSRSGVQPLGFQEPIVLLTGVHFHYAGFLLPILTGLAGQTLRTRLARLAAALVCVAVPLVALGITLAPQGIRIVEWWASWLMAAAGILVTLLQLQLARRASHLAARLLFAVSGLSLAAGMVLAAVYALGTYWGRDWLTIPDMLPWHGGLNALGFAVPGLLAWLMVTGRVSVSARAVVPGNDKQ